MPEEEDRSAFLALGLEPRVRLSFSGYRAYKLEDVEADSEAVIANLVPVDMACTIPSGKEFDRDYQDWLDDHGMNDPVYDEVTLPYYSSWISLPGQVGLKPLTLVVEVLQWSRCPRVRMSLR